MKNLVWKAYLDQSLRSAAEKIKSLMGEYFDCLSIQADVCLVHPSLGDTVVENLLVLPDQYIYSPNMFYLGTANMPSLTVPEP